eukprot:Colp12_sorted_trinity150504_noHs@31768
MAENLKKRKAEDGGGPNKKRKVKPPKEDKELLEKMKKYQRGEKIKKVKQIEDKKLRGNLKKTEKKFKDAATRAAQSEILLTEEAGYLEAEGMEKTFKFTQKQIAEHVDVSSSNKIFDLDLDKFGPYKVNYTRNGKYMLIGGRKGHIGAFDWKAGKLQCELHLKETVRDVQWLHNETMFAVAQRKYVYIYDSTGTELHCLRSHIEVNRLDFLPYHFLMVSVGNSGYLKYHDTSTGQLVAEHRTRLGRCDVMAQNPYNAVMQLGHHNGTVTMWTPNMSTAVVKMLCHKGPVQAIAVDPAGNHMVTAGLDGQVKVWDVRTYKQLHAYYTATPASTLTISQRGLLAVGFGPNLQVWKDAFASKQQSPYMSQVLAGKRIESLEFCPFEDVLGIAHSHGLASFLVPGSGEPNYDTLEVNPLQTKKQRQEAEVKMLLEKIKPEMITLNPDVIGTVDRASKELIEEERKLAFEANNPGQTYQPKFRMRGRSSSMRRFLNKQTNVIDANKIAAREKLQKQQEEREKVRKGIIEEPKPRTALDRFASKFKK